MDIQYWKQPAGLWTNRGASISLCNIALGFFHSSIEDKDHFNNHLWHYWAQCEKPELLDSYILKFPEILRNTSNQKGESALWRLVLLGKLEAVRIWYHHWPQDFLLSHHTSLLIPAAWSGNFDLFRFILNMPEQILDYQDQDGMTPLMIAIHRQSIEAWSLLLENGANPHLLDFKMKNALHHLAEYGNLESFQILEAYGGDLEQLDIDQKTPEMIFNRTQQKPKGIDKALKKRWEHKYQEHCFF